VCRHPQDEVLPFFTEYGTKKVVAPHKHKNFW